MAREGLRTELASAIQQAIIQKKQVIREGASIKTNGDVQRVRITVKPLPGKEQTTDRLAVLFEEMPQVKRLRGLKTTLAGEGVKEMEQELQFTRESLRSTVEELETANEELVKVNTEYQNKIEELSTINDDMKNLLNSTGIATILIDSDRRIKHYTAVATEIFNLIETDVGRPIEHVTSSLKFDSLDSITKKASESLVPIKQEVQTRDGRWYSMRVHPYRTSGNTIAGVVMSFIDINEYKNGEKRDPDKEKTMKRLR